LGSGMDEFRIVFFHDFLVDQQFILALLFEEG
jgi:hypothetical protein